MEGKPSYTSNTIAPTESADAYARRMAQTCDWCDQPAPVLYPVVRPRPSCAQELVSIAEVCDHCTDDVADTPAEVNAVFIQGGTCVASAQTYEDYIESEFAVRARHLWLTI